MKLDHIHVSGFKNLLNANLRLPRAVTALIGFNNYGKSNFISAIDFTFRFISGDAAERQQLLAAPYIRPLLTTLSGTPFTCDIAFSDGDDSYQYRLQWLWQDEPSVLSESLLRNGEAIYRRLGASVINAQARQISGLQLEIDSHPHPAADYLRQLSVCVLHDHTPVRLFDASECRIGEAVHELRRYFPGDYDLLIDAFLGLLPDIECMDLVERGGQWNISYRKQYIDGPLPYDFLSTGSKRLFQLLFAAVQGRRSNLDLLVFEEVENSIHPRLIPMLLMALSTLAGDSQIILTSHSPYLIQHLPLESITLALPPQLGASGFRRINPVHWQELSDQARDLDISLGVYLFDLLIESHYQPQELMRWLQ